MHQTIVDAKENVNTMNPNEQICHTADEDTMFCYAVLADNNENTIYSNLPGRFTVQSFSGQNLFSVAYIYNIKTILLYCMKSCSNLCMVNVFEDVYDYLQTRKLKLNLYMLNNEFSRAV